jgi:DNA-binding transcriptional MocR family regulator
MKLRVDRHSGVPAYLQVKEQLIAFIKAGLLKPGDALPSSRKLAGQLNVARNTVLQAYLELAAEHWIETRPGSKTCVSAAPPATPPEEVEYPSTDAPVGEVRQMDYCSFEFSGEGFALPQYYKKWKGPQEYISFAKALPDPRQFPFGRIKKISSNLLWYPQEFFFDRGHPQGHQPLVEHLEQTLSRELIDMSPGVNEVVICAGFQVGLNMLLTLLHRPGTAVAVENPTYASILNCLIARKLPYVPVPVERDGMDVDYLTKRVEREKVGLIVTVPTLHNPTATVMSAEKRRALLALAQKHNIPIIEDAWSMFLPAEGLALPTLKAEDRGGHVFLIGSFSKSFLPGLRIGFVCTPGEMAVSLVKLKRATERSDSFFLQALLLDFIKKGYMDLHVRKMARVYAERRRATQEAMREHFPRDFRWEEPPGGFYFWVEMPPKLQSMPLLEHCVQRGVEFAPAKLFFAEKRDANYLRLAYSMLTKSQIREGIERLGGAIIEYRKRDGVK